MLDALYPSSMPLNCSGLLRVCNDGEAPGGQCRPNALGRKTVRLRSANWRSALYNVWLAQVVLQEQLQIPVEIIEYGGGAAGFYALGGGDGLDPHAYNWDALVRGGDDPSCTGLPSSGLTSAEKESSRPPSRIGDRAVVFM